MRKSRLNIRWVVRNLFIYDKFAFSFLYFFFFWLRLSLDRLIGSMAVLLSLWFYTVLTATLPRNRDIFSFH